MILLQKRPIILASSSPVRKQILQDLGFDFQTINPDFDEESAKDDIRNLEIPKQALFLAQQKALSISIKYPDSIIIGSDQICQIDNKILSKSRNIEDAYSQLQELSGKTHFQNNAISIFQSGKEIFSNIEIATIKMRNLSSEEIENYLRIDNPIGCSGSYKIEKNARHLFESINGDVNAIAGISIQSALNYLHQNNLITLIIPNPTFNE